MSTMPSVDIKFNATLGSALVYAERGTVGIILKDAAASSLSENGFELRSVSEIPSALGTDNAAYIQRALLGSDTAPEKVLVYVLAADASALTEALAWFAAHPVNYIVAGPDCSETEAKALAAWAIDQDSNYHGHVVAVVPNYAAGSQYVVNFVGAGMTDGTNTFTTAEYCSRIAGMLAGCADDRTVTFRAISELTDCTRLSESDAETAVEAGKLIVRFDGKQVTLGAEVNSLANGTGVSETLQSIHAVDLILRIDEELRTIASGYMDRLNSEDNQYLVVSAVQGYLSELQEDGLLTVNTPAYLDISAKTAALKAQGVDTSDMKDKQIAEYGKSVYISADFTLYLGMEQFHFQLSI